MFWIDPNSFCFQPINRNCYKHWIMILYYLCSSGVLWFSAYFEFLLPIEDASWEIITLKSSVCFSYTCINSNSVGAKPWNKPFINHMSDTGTWQPLVIIFVINSALFFYWLNKLLILALVISLYLSFLSVFTSCWRSCQVWLCWFT